ncbi:MAG TPA: ABC transporter permease subunit [candidate division Zixibacteria bacterium]|nr:ABC transporter permease subunit [candidate division Zixibacteria bacterium]
MFRLLWQEILFRRNAIIGWGLALCFFPVVYMSLYPSVADEMQSLADLEIYQAMGVSVGNFGDWIASTVILFVPLLASIYALINGTGTLAGEEEDGRLEMIVTLPLPRWQIVTVKAVALSAALFIILLMVSLVSALVFLAIESQVETKLAAIDMITGLLGTWPITFAFAMISMFLAAFCSRRRVAALIATALVIVSYFGSNLSNMVSSLEPLRPLFLHTYLDSTGSSLTEGQQASDMLVLLVVGLVAFALAILFFQRRDITVGAWPWQRAKASA